MDTPFRGYRFSDFRLELAKRRLTGPEGAAIPLSGRAYDVLVYLVEHRERVVGKEELFQAVWPRTIVEDNNLNQAISAVRRALGDSRDEPRFIVTVAGRGYRFVGDVSPLAERAAEAREAAVAPGPDTPTPRRAILAGVAIAAAVAAVEGGLWWNHAQRSRLPRSIAVLPFRPLLPDASNPAMELGVTELLANRLSRLPGIVV